MQPLTPPRRWRTARRNPGPIRSPSSSGVTIDLRDGRAEGGDAEGDLLSGIEDLGGSKHADILSGDESSNELIGRRGDDILSMTRELAVLLRAGLPIDRALKVMIDMAAHERLRYLLEDLLSSVKSGKGLSEALAAYPKEFNFPILGPRPPDYSALSRKFSTKPTSLPMPARSSSM